MLLNIDTTIPFHEPVIVFAIVLLITLLSPILLNKIKVPGIIGMILAGVIIGPYGFNLIEREGAIHLFGTVGLLYIMFLAGLEIDRNHIRTKGKQTILFGLITFIVPFIFGYIFGNIILKYSILSSFIIAILFSTQTLVSYPIINRLGITKSKPVLIAIGGTIITDTIVLVFLAVIVNIYEGNNSLRNWLEFIIGFIAFILFVLYIGPMIARWVFKNLAGEGGAQFTFVLTIVFLSSFLAQLVGVENIIGAFLAGLALNKLIPNKSALMNRINFVGNNIFIPFFLISVGMLVNYTFLFESNTTLLIYFGLIFTAISSKFIAALIFQKLTKASRIERNLIFGLSTAHAAAMLAIALVGFRLELIDETILNGTVLVILFSSLISSFIVSQSGKNLVVEQSLNQIAKRDIDERVMITISNPQTIQSLIDFSVLINAPISIEPIYALAVVEDDDDAAKKFEASKKMLHDAVIHASATETKIEIITRIDLSISYGILRSMKELNITNLIIGWADKSSTVDKIFGSILDNILPSSNQLIYVVKILQPMNTFKRINIVLPEFAEFETGFSKWIYHLQIIAVQIQAKCIFWGTEITLQKTKEIFNSQTTTTFNFFQKWEQIDSVTSELNQSDLLFIIKSRPGSISYQQENENIPKKLSREYSLLSFVMVYPNQSE